MRNMPRWNQRLLREQELASDHGRDVTLLACEQCGFVMLADGPDAGYYDDEYVNAPGSSPQMRAAQQAQAGAFVERFGLAGRRVLEVGCGDGSYLECLRQAGAEASGIEPSAAQRAIALGRGLDVADGYLSDGRMLAGAPFDAFVTRQVFEHVIDLRGFLRGIRANLAGGAVGLVEVPNFEALLAQGRYFDFFPEHVNYFTPRTLRAALELQGFDVIETAPAIEGEALAAFVRLDAPADFGPSGRLLGTLAREMEAFVAESRARGGQVAVWGAGGKGLSILAGVDLSGVDYLLDGDPHKAGRYTPVSHLRVSHPDVLRQADVRAVLITAPAYQREIRATLEETYGFRGRIALLDGGVRVVQEAE
ncbi:NDP-hexose methyltransferase [Luteitalea sp. TBR-22]|nr:NDP-hexose methyltransferase [Luteitalea sp. TBR-22]